MKWEIKLAHGASVPLNFGEVFPPGRRFGYEDFAARADRAQEDLPKPVVVEVAVQSTSREEF